MKLLIVHTARRNVIDWLLAAAFVLPLIGYAYIGSYSRYMADDYSASRIVKTHGFVGAQVSQYQGWTGRFSFTFVNSLIALLGPATPPFIPVLLVTLWFAGAVWASYEIHSSSLGFSWPRVVLFAALLIFATLALAPNVSQSLYWQTGALTYVAPFIPLSMFVAVLGRSMRESHQFNVFFACILTFVAAGFSDAFAVLQTCTLILILLAVEIFAGVDFKARSRTILIAGLAGSLIALAIVAAAPGNSIRQAYFPKRFGAAEMLGLTAWYSVGFVAKLVLTHPITFVALLTIPLLVVLRDAHEKPAWDRRLCIRLLVITPVAVLLVIMCGVAASVYAISVMLPERARILLSLIFVCGTVVWSRAAGEYLAGRLLTANGKFRIATAATTALLLLALLPVISFFSVLKEREGARSFAVDWDRQDADLKTAKQLGITDATVPQIGDFQSRIGEGASDLHLRPDPAFWINREVATYYGLRSVRASEDAR